jgi:hypothetical protein
MGHDPGFKTTARTTLIVILNVSVGPELQAVYRRDVTHALG